MNITGTASASVVLDETLAIGLEAGRSSLSRLPSRDILAGTASGQCDLKWAASFTLAAGATTTLVVSALVDSIGRAVAFVRVKVFLLETDATLAGDVLTVGNAASHPWAAIAGGPTNTFAVPPLGFVAKVAMGDGFVVSVGSSDQLLVTNSGTHPVTFRITMAGCSA